MLKMNPETQKAYLIGGGIASLASAAYLIRDGKFAGKNIYIFETGKDLGGSLDGQGSPEAGYVIRGIRMFSEEVYTCTFDLFSFIPLNNNSTKTLLDDFIDFNREIKVTAKARLVENKKIIDAANFGLSVVEVAKIVEIITLPESLLRDSMISKHFSPTFFTTNFWLEWCTTFSFQPWHSAVEFRRYLRRFIQEFPEMSTMTVVRQTRYNQNDSIIRPITNWLKRHGVNFVTESRVTVLEFTGAPNQERVKNIELEKKNARENILVDENDLVFLTNGSITANSPEAWVLWKNISIGRPHFGRPEVFCNQNQIDKTKWESFSVTYRDRAFVDRMENFSQNKSGTGGITTLKDSNWLISIVIPPQPHFINQPADVSVLWGYSLFPDKLGNYVPKKMSDCTGEEILIEVCSHLGFTEELPKILPSSTCLPCLMPYITSQFMPRKKTDRPLVIPKNTKNFAFVGQFCEIPDEITFTVEHSVRSAIMAVRKLLGIKKRIPPIYKGHKIAEIVRSSFQAISSSI
jgi:oleate hydratase